VSIDLQPKETETQEITLVIAVTLTVVTTHVIIGTIDVDTIVGTIVTGTADETAAVADFGHVTLTDAVVTTIEEAVMITDDEITMTTIHVITIQDHVIMTEEIMIDDQMMKILRRPIQDGEIWIRIDEMTAQMVTTEAEKAVHVMDDITMDHVTAIGTDMMMDPVTVDVMDPTATDVDLTVVRRAVMTHLKPLRRTKHGVSFNHVTNVLRKNCSPVPCPESISTSTMIFQFLQVVKMFQNLSKIFSLVVWDQLLPKMSNWQIIPSQPQSKNGLSQLSTRVGISCLVPKPVPVKLLPSLCPCSVKFSTIQEKSCQIEAERHTHWPWSYPQHVS
jgi:hypothetical protein